MTDILFIDDDEDLRRATAQTLALAGLAVEAIDGTAAALRRIEEGFDGVVVTDIRMPGMDGLALLARLVARDPDMPVILVSAHADVPTAVGALKQGAYDVLEKPYAPDQLVATVARALERRRLVHENRSLRAATTAPEVGPLLGHAPAIEQVRRTVAQIGAIDIDVLIEGETGTGKSMVAAMLHALSRRRGQMVTVDCGALPATSFESELFGHVAGAVPGGAMPRTGRIEQAHRGTLFLDEVDAMAEHVQLKLQRVLEHREVYPVGSPGARQIDLRVIGASNVDLEELSKSGRFRSSLLYRLNGVTLRLPPLRERQDDIVPLFRTFVARAAKRLDVPVPALNARDFRHLEQHDWPGNVRELIRFAENVVLGLSDADAPLAGHIPATDGDLKSRVDRFEAQAIEDALIAARGDATQAMGLLHLPRKTFYYKVKRFGIDLNRFRS